MNDWKWEFWMAQALNQNHMQLTIDPRVGPTSTSVFFKELGETWVGEVESHVSIFCWSFCVSLTVE